MTTTRKPAVPATVDEVLPATVDPHGIARAVTDSTALDELDGLDLDPDGGAIPFLPFNRKVGQDDSGVLVGGERKTELEFIWAARATSRSHFPKSYDKDPNGRPDCWSSSGTHPDAGVAEPRATSCAACPYSFEQTGGGDTPDGSPGCSKSLEALIYLEENGMSRVARMRFGGLAFKAARDYWNSFGFGRPKVRPVQFMSRMTLVSTKTDNGNFFVPEFSRVAKLADEEALAIGRDAKGLLGQFTSMVAEDIVEASARDSHDSGGPGPFDDDPTAPFAPASAPATPARVDAETGEIVRPVANRPEGREEIF